MAICIFQVCRDDWKWLFANLDEESNGLTSGVVCDELSEWEQLPRRADGICASRHTNARFLQSFMTEWLWGQNIESKSLQFLETIFKCLYPFMSQTDIPDTKRMIWMVTKTCDLLIGLISTSSSKQWNSALKLKYAFHSLMYQKYMSQRVYVCYCFSSTVNGFLMQQFFLALQALLLSITSTEKQASHNLLRWVPLFSETNWE